MDSRVHPAAHPLRFPFYLAALALVSWTLLRVVLWVKFHPSAATAGDALRAFAAGLHADIAMAALVPVVVIGFGGFLAGLFSLPVWAVQRFVPGPRRLPVWRFLFSALVCAALFAGVFLLISEWYFFDEFECRFNTVAIDYLIYPHEVFTNIQESYPVPLILAACLVFGGGAAWFLFQRYRPDWRLAGIGAAGFGLLLGLPVVWALYQLSVSRAVMGGVVYLVVAAAAGWWFLRRRREGDGRRVAMAVGWAVVAAGLYFSVLEKESGFSSQRVVNELATNGWASAIRAARTRDLPYTAFYATLPRDEAFRRARVLLSGPGITFPGPEVPPAPQPGEDGHVDPAAETAWLDAARESLVREVAGDAARPKLNMCIIVVESFGSEFWGSLGRVNKEGKPETMTPEMDRIAAEDGTLFTNLFADGNRTIRGFEGVFSSFPPLPGDSILARDKTEGVETIAQVFKRDGYRTLFVYGGHGTFDYLRSYTIPNGWDRLIEQRDFENPVHTTAWGVSDEDLLNRGLSEMTEMHGSGKPFLISFMTVSNHRPFTFPEGRISGAEGLSSRLKVVRYTDWAIGDFLRKAKATPFWENTIFAVVADHGARVYGSQTIPLQSYRIPLLLTGGPLRSLPRRVETTGCQLDVAPTLLGLVGRPYRSLFFGHDLLQPGAEERSLCLMHHNRSIAAYRAGRQVVYGLNKAVEYWQGDAAAGKMVRVGSADEPFRELQDDGAALFRAADELYNARRYLLP